MGLLHTAILSRRGCRVVVFDNDPETYSAALAAGASCCERPSALGNPVAVRSWTDNWGFDLLVCTRFGGHGVSLALGAAARGAHLVLYQSIEGNDRVEFSANWIHYHEIEIIGTIAQTASDVYEAVGLMAEDHTIVDMLRTKVVPIANFQEAFEMSLNPQVNRVAIDFR
jgi:L-iditol 2-dehydrogenase